MVCGVSISKEQGSELSSSEKGLGVSEGGGLWDLVDDRYGVRKRKCVALQDEHINHGWARGRLGWKPGQRP